jgi:hypothetical protein
MWDGGHNVPSQRHGSKKKKRGGGSIVSRVCNVCEENGTRARKKHRKRISIEKYEKNKEGKRVKEAFRNRSKLARPISRDGHGRFIADTTHSAPRRKSHHETMMLGEGLIRDGR